MRILQSILHPHEEETKKKLGEGTSAWSSISIVDRHLHRHRHRHHHKPSPNYISENVEEPTRTPEVRQTNSFTAPGFKQSIHQFVNCRQQIREKVGKSVKKKSKMKSHPHLTPNAGNHLQARKVYIWVWCIVIGYLNNKCVGKWDFTNGTTAVPRLSLHPSCWHWCCCYSLVHWQ